MRSIPLSSTREYNAWHRAKQRCYNPNHHNYKHYGGRGIAMYEPWHQSSVLFCHDIIAEIGPHPGAGYTLDRIDNHGDYAPSNVRWATMIEQHNNYRQNRLFTYKGKTQTVTRWVAELGLNYHTVNSRLHRGWTIKRALFSPLLRR